MSIQENCQRHGAHSHETVGECRMASKRKLKSEARMHDHKAMMSAWIRFLDKCGADRPIEGEKAYSDMLSAFRCGWNAKRHS